MADDHEGPARVPPRWFVRLAWRVHRGLYRGTGGRIGLWRPKADKWGTLQLTTTGRRSGLERSVLLGYVEDGGDLVTLAMNGWGAPEPAWWLNLQAQPQAAVVLRDREFAVTGHAAQGEERARLWARWQQIDKKLDSFAALRPRETAVVVLRPVDPPGRGLT